MKIGELAQVAHCTVETVRYYEKQGLLPAPARTPGNFRLYGPEHVERLCFIRNCRGLDMSHDEIHALQALADQPAAGCGAINDVFDQHIAHVDDAYTNSASSSSNSQRYAGDVKTSRRLTPAASCKDSQRCKPNPSKNAILIWVD